MIWTIFDHISDLRKCRQVSDCGTCESCLETHEVVMSITVEDLKSFTYTFDIYMNKIIVRKETKIS